MTSHSIVGPSARSRWRMCPASVRRSEGLLDTGSIYATEGTHAHTVAEIVARRAFGLEITADCESGLTEAKVTAAMLTGATGYTEFLRSLLPDPSVVMIEEPLVFRDDARMFGTADFIGYSAWSRKLVVADYKFGKSPVDVGFVGALNPQLEAYALMALDKLDTHQLEKVETVTYAIYQPRAWKKRPPGSSVTVPVKHLQVERRPVLLREIKAALDAVDPVAFAGGHCQFCRAKSSCPDYNKKEGTTPDHQKNPFFFRKSS